MAIGDWSGGPGRRAERRPQIGVIGVGHHATTALYPSFETAGLDVAAVCARHQDHADVAARRWRVPHAFDNAEAMLASTELDGVVICVPPTEYGPLIRLALEANMPAFCEKPAAATGSEAATLAEQSSNAGVPIVVGYMKRFAPAYVRARELIRMREFGEPSLASFTFVVGQTPEYAQLRHYMIDNPVHHLDLVRYLLGELEDLQAHSKVCGAGAALAVTARTEQGAACTFNFATTGSWVQRNERVDVYGEGHAVCVDNIATCIHRPPERPAHVWEPNYTVSARDGQWHSMAGFVPALEHFRDVVTGRCESLSDLASAAKTLAYAEVLYELVSADGARGELGRDPAAGDDDAHEAAT